MKFRLVEEFRDKEYRDNHYDRHVLGKDQYYTNTLFFDEYDYPDTEEGREQYEKDADMLARMWESAGVSRRFRWMPELQPGDVAGFEAKLHNTNHPQNCYILFQPENTSYGKLVLFIPNSPLAPKTGNLIKTFFSISMGNYLSMVRSDDYVNELPQNKQIIDDFQALPEEEQQKQYDQAQQGREKVFAKKYEQKQKMKQKLRNKRARY